MELVRDKPTWETIPLDGTELRQQGLGRFYRVYLELTPKVNVYRESMLPWVGSVEGIKSFSQAAVRG